MDFDSSSKFISSLAKFLQSLCNGYVEFNNGVEVIGHIYLSVDTGKKIDYILNEKVCKTDENSVTFISNSFHAQPAEKPKPPAKTSQTPDLKLSDTSSKVDEDDIIIMEDEVESKNTETIPPRDRYQNSSNLHQKVHRPPKRSFNQSFPSSHKHSVKHSRSDPSSGPNGSQLDTDSIHYENTSNFLPSQLASETTITAATESDMSHLSQVFPKNFNDSINSQNTSEEKDIKPQLDSEMKIIQVKQEYEQTGHSGDDNQESFDDSQDQGSVFPGMPYDQYYGDGRRGQKLEYGHIGALSQDFFQAGPSGEAGGDSSGDNTDKTTMLTSYSSTSSLWMAGLGCPVRGCGARKIPTSTRLREHWTEKHEEIVPKYHCSVCHYSSKRKGNLFMHFRKKHKDGNLSRCIGRIDFQHNKEFEDPSPLTLEAVLFRNKEQPFMEV